MFRMIEPPIDHACWLDEAPTDHLGPPLPRVAGGYHALTTAGSIGALMAGQRLFAHVQAVTSGRLRQGWHKGQGRQPRLGALAVDQVGNGQGNG